jgi:hypothetical protein
VRVSAERLRQRADDVRALAEEHSAPERRTTFDVLELCLRMVAEAVEIEDEEDD